MSFLFAASVSFAFCSSAFLASKTPLKQKRGKVLRGSTGGPAWNFFYCLIFLFFADEEEQKKKEAEKKALEEEAKKKKEENARKAAAKAAAGK